MKERQLDGSVRTYVDEDMKQSIILNLLEKIPDFPLEEAEKKAFTLGKSLAEDIRIKRDYIEQREMQEEIREHFKALVRMNKESWEHEYEYWNRLNWK